MRLGIVTKQRHGKEALTESTLLDLLLRLRKDGEQFDHYLHDDLRHQRAQRDLGINFEAFEEAPDGLKEFEESVIARADSFSRLVVISEGDGRPAQNEGKYTR